MSRRSHDPVNSMGWRTSFKINLDDRLADLFGKWCSNQGFERGQEHNAIRLLLEEYFASTPDMGSAHWARTVAYKETREEVLRRVFASFREIEMDLRKAALEGGLNVG